MGDGKPTYMGDGEPTMSTDTVAIFFRRLHEIMFGVTTPAILCLSCDDDATPSPPPSPPDSDDDDEPYEHGPVSSVSFSNGCEIHHWRACWTTYSGICEQGRPRLGGGYHPWPDTGNTI